MCLYDTIVLFYALNTEQFNYKQSIFPRKSRLRLFQYQNWLNLAYLVAPSLTLPET